MSRVKTFTVALLRDWARNREAVFFSLLFPVLLLVIFSSVFAGGSAEFALAVQNNDVVDGEPTNLSAAFVDRLEQTGALDVRTLEPGRNVTAWSRSEAASGTTRVLVIPEGFAERVRTQSLRVRLAVIEDTLTRFGDRANGTGATVEQRRALREARNATNATGSVPVTLYTASDDQAAGAVGSIVAGVVSRFNDASIGVTAPPVAVRGGDLGGQRRFDAVDYFLPALIAAVLLINGVITMTALVAGYNDDGTLERLVATPLRRRDWILANVVHQALLALLVTAVMVAVAHLVFGVTAVPGPLSIGLILVGAVGFSAIGMSLGSFVDDPEVATTLGNAIGFPLMFLSGVFWEIGLMPSYLQVIGRLSPLYHFHQALRRLMILETTEGVLVPAAVVVGTAVVGVALAIATTRWGDFGE